MEKYVWTRVCFKFQIIKMSFCINKIKSLPLKFSTTNWWGKLSRFIFVYLLSGFIKMLHVSLSVMLDFMRFYRYSFKEKNIQEKARRPHLSDNYGDRRCTFSNYMLREFLSWIGSNLAYNKVIDDQKSKYFFVFILWTTKPREAIICKPSAALLIDFHVTFQLYETFSTRIFTHLINY